MTKRVNVFAQDRVTLDLLGNEDEIYQKGEKWKVCKDSTCLNDKKSKAWLKEKGLGNIDEGASLKEIGDYLRLYSDITRPTYSTGSALGVFFGITFAPIAIPIYLSRDRAQGRLGSLQQLEQHLKQQTQGFIKSLGKVGRIDVETRGELLAQVSSFHPKMADLRVALPSLRMMVERGHAAYLADRIFSDARIGYLSDMAENILRLNHSLAVAGAQLPQDYIPSVSRLALVKARASDPYLRQAANDIQGVNTGASAGCLIPDFERYIESIRTSGLSTAHLGYDTLDAFADAVAADVAQGLILQVDEALKENPARPDRQRLETFRSFLNHQIVSN